MGETPGGAPSEPGPELLQEGRAGKVPPRPRKQPRLRGGGAGRARTPTPAARPVRALGRRGVSSGRGAGQRGQTAGSDSVRFVRVRPHPHLRGPNRDGGCSRVPGRRRGAAPASELPQAAAGRPGPFVAALRSEQLIAAAPPPAAPARAPPMGGAGAPGAALREVVTNARDLAPGPRRCGSETSPGNKARAWGGRAGWGGCRGGPGTGAPGVGARVWAPVDVGQERGARPQWPSLTR